MKKNDQIEAMQSLHIDQMNAQQVEIDRLTSLLENGWSVITDDEIEIMAREVGDNEPFFSEEDWIKGFKACLSIIHLPNSTQNPAVSDTTDVDSSNADGNQKTTGE